MLIKLVAATLPNLHEASGTDRGEQITIRGVAGVLPQFVE
jgi:hypothetical protein